MSNRAPVRNVLLTLASALALLSLASCRGNGSSEPLGAASGQAPATADADTDTAPAKPARSARPSPETTATPNPPMDKTAATTATATLAAGCFWCIEAVLERLDGVIRVDSGYMGGDVDNPSYEQVCTGSTGHAEVVQVEFDPSKIAYRELLDWFFQAHDPTTRNRQGNDYGTQYRSAIFFHSDEQRQVAEQAMAAWQDHYHGKIVTEITKATAFWRADEYHQDFYRRNPQQGYCRAIIPPKLKKLGLDHK